MILEKLFVSQSLILIGISERWELVAWTKNSTQFSVVRLHLVFFHQKLLNNLGASTSKVFNCDSGNDIDFRRFNDYFIIGILLFGPPGTGKTLMARQIGNMLNAREPKIVNGPQILDKYVGESEANIRRLFADAEEEEKRVKLQVDKSLMTRHLI